MPSNSDKKVILFGTGEMGLNALYIANLRMMRGVYRELGSEFISVLQPTMLTCAHYKCNAIEQEYINLSNMKQAVKNSLVFIGKL